MSDEFEGIDQGPRDLDGRLRGASRASHDELSVGRVRQVVSAKVTGAAPARAGRAFRGRLVAAAAVAVPLAEAAGIAVVILGQPRSASHLVVPAPSASPAVSASPSDLRPSLPPAASLAGFQPFGLSAISETEYWVVGCALADTHTRVIHTTDGGAHFSALAPLPADALSCDDRTETTTRDLRFADRSDGWVFGSGRSGSGVWSTHDGGQSWAGSSLPGLVDKLEPGAGNVYASVCCRGTTDQLMQTASGRDAWSNVGLDLKGNGRIGVHASSLWAMVDVQDAALWASV
ncbi:MAG: hypothetical protein ABR532_03100, partial [Candidatus Dormibacteria bacterium]